MGWHEGYVACVAVSPDGNWAASGGYDGVLKIWALVPGAVEGHSVTNLYLGESPVSGVTFSPDGRRLAASTWTNGLVVFRVQGWQTELAVTELVAGIAPVQLDSGVTVAFSPDSRLLAAISWNDDVAGEVWNVDTRTRVCTLPCRKFNQGDPAVAWLPNSQTVAGFSSNGRADAPGSPPSFQLPGP